VIPGDHATKLSRRPQRPVVQQIYRRRVQAGFTLVETLAALVVLGLLIGGLVQGLRLGVRAWQAQTRTLTNRGDMDAVETMLRTLIERMDPGGVSGRPPIFKGASHSLLFTTTLPETADTLATRVVESTLAVDESHQLQLLLLPHDRNRLAAPPRPEHVALLGDVDHLEISYWQQPKEGWQTAWPGPTLPNLIRVRLVFLETSGRHAPDIVIKPMRDRWRP
jgi:general secretion pathway protein J